MNDEQEFDYLNVIPLVDVMLVLLTIVLTTSTFIATGSIQVNLPRAEEGGTTTPMRPRDIVVDREGRIWLDGAEIALDALAAALDAVPRDTPILLRADRALPLQGFVDVYECIRGQGFTRLGLQTEKR